MWEKNTFQLCCWAVYWHNTAKHISFPCYSQKENLGIWCDQENPDLDPGKSTSLDTARDMSWPMPWSSGFGPHTGSVQSLDTSALISLGLWTDYDKKMHRIFFFVNTVSNCCCCCWFLIQQQHQHIYLIEGIVGVFALRISCSEWVYPWTMKISLTFTLSKKTAFTASTFTGCLTRSHMLPITLNTHSPGPFAPGKERAQRPRSGKYNNVSWERKQVLAARETQHKYIEWWNGDRTFSTSLRGVPVKMTLTY